MSLLDAMLDFQYMSWSTLSLAAWARAQELPCVSIRCSVPSTHLPPIVHSDAHMDKEVGHALSRLHVVSGAAGVPGDAWKLVELRALGPLRRVHDHACTSCSPTNQPLLPAQMHCPSPAAFLDGLQSAGELMASWPGTPCLLVDNVAAFFHLERAAGAAAGEQGASMHARALGTLRDLACAKQAVVVASKLSLFGKAFVGRR